MTQRESVSEINQRWGRVRWLNIAPFVGGTVAESCPATSLVYRIDPRHPMAKRGDGSNQAWYVEGYSLGPEILCSEDKK